MIEEWVTAEGKYFSGISPQEARKGHFGNKLHQLILYLHHGCQVTQPLIKDFLLDLGIDISSGQINKVLSEKHDTFHKEKEEILKVGLEISSHIQVDDTGAHHKGKNGYTLHVGNEYFAWFKSGYSKSRINFLSALNNENPQYIVNVDAQNYMQTQGIPRASRRNLHLNKTKIFHSDEEWKDHLKLLEITQANHVRIATEAVLYASLLQKRMSKEIVILSDDAGQFRVPTLNHALCWVHAERWFEKLLPITKEQKSDLERVIDEIWLYYEKLKKFKVNPHPRPGKQLRLDFDELFSKKTCFQSLNLLLKRMHDKKRELLMVLEHPEIPLHDNLSESDIREFVKRRKVSGGTRSNLGKDCQDTFASLKKTCRKLKVSFWNYIGDTKFDV